MATVAPPTGSGDQGWLSLGISAAEFIVMACSQFIIGLWTLHLGRKKTLEKLDEKIQKRSAEVESRIETLQNVVADNKLTSYSEVETLGRNFGEVVTALKEKMSIDMDFVRDHFVRETVFTRVIDEMKENWRRFEDKTAGRFDSIQSDINSRLDRILEKLSDKQDRS